MWSVNLDGTDPRIMTTLPMDVEGLKLSPDGSLLLFTSEVYPVCETKGAKAGVSYDMACNKAQHDEEMNAKMKARTYSALLYRHWTSYEGRSRRHILIETLNNTFTVRDLTPGRRDTPPFSLGGPDGYAFSPDSVQIAYTGNDDPDLSTSTNSDIFLVDAAGGDSRKITVNPGADEGPVFSPDGKSIAYRTQLHPGFESDQWRLAVMDLCDGGQPYDCRTVGSLGVRIHMVFRLKADLLHD